MKGIPMTGESVTAILEGGKTESRRLFNGEIEFNADRSACTVLRKSKNGITAYHRLASELPDLCTYKVGELLYVKETYSVVPATAYRQSLADLPGDPSLQHRVSPDGFSWAVYKQGWDRCAPHWKSPRFMPQWASRLTLRVTAVSVEQLHDITEEGAIAEGAEPDYEIVCGKAHLPGTARNNFAGTWDYINEKRASWPSNPWVMVLRFEVVRPESEVQRLSVSNERRP